jgi:2'-5' RNA ligase
MQPAITTLPGYKINEYLVVVSPHEELWNKIQKVKEEFGEAYQSANARWSKPHLVLVSFTQYAMMEERIINRLHQVAMAQYPFRVELKNFGSFPSHTIYINVTSKVPIQTLVKEIRQDGQRLMKLNDENKPHFMMEPHLTIARKLKPWQYEKGWLEYSNKHFTGRFIANKMLLLKRPVGELKYQVAGRFDFQNLPITIKQGELFG